MPRRLGMVTIILAVMTLPTLAQERDWEAVEIQVVP